MKGQLKYFVAAIVNSYAILFFSQNKILGILLLLVSFFNFHAGVAGFICVCTAVLLLKTMGFNIAVIKTGMYSYNSLLLGIGFGTFYNFNPAFWLWLAAASLFCIVLSVTLSALLGKYALPALSIPFVLTFWLVLVAASGYAGMGLLQKDSYVVFELDNSATRHLSHVCQYFDGLDMPFYLALFFRSLSAVLFQNSILAGIFMSVGLLIHSRIGFSLLVIGFIAACLINQLTGTYPDGMSYYHLGANFMMVCTAIGGFFLIPSFRSYLWALLAIPITFLIVNGLSVFLGIYNLPVLSFPFCLVTLGLLYFFVLRSKPQKIQLTPLQNYSPETNLYQFLSGKERLKEFEYLPINLPFMGEWTVSQGYRGTITHTGDWGHALDFVLKDLDNQTYEVPGTIPEQYYCFNKPVLACADGQVQELINHIDDNEIGQVNLQQNWGNTIVIKHAEGLYTKVSHLKKNSAKVKAGDFVKQGDIIALCGNSGRSPEPHLHFQVQGTPYIGSKTMDYPFAHFVLQQENEETLKSFTVPDVDQTIQSPEINAALKHAFHFEPGFSTRLSAENGRQETWEVCTDAFNSTYFFCHENQAIAYFVNNGTLFYFSRFYGDRSSMLFQFYRTAYKVDLSGHPVEDLYAVDAEVFNPALWLQDFIAPFYRFLKYIYSNKLVKNKEGWGIEVPNASIFIGTKGITGFEVKHKNKKTSIKWETS